MPRMAKILERSLFSEDVFLDFKIKIQNILVNLKTLSGSLIVLYFAS